MGEWQDISTAPKDGTFILAICEADCSTRNHWIVRWENDGWVCGSDAEGFTDLAGGTFVPCIGRWMPLPPNPAPKE